MVTEMCGFEPGRWPLPVPVNDVGKVVPRVLLNRELVGQRLAGKDRGQGLPPISSGQGLSVPGLAGGLDIPPLLLPGGRGRTGARAFLKAEGTPSPATLLPGRKGGPA